MPGSSCARTTLYAREHTGAVREMLCCVGEDLGVRRPGQVVFVQAQTYARTFLECEKQRKCVNAEYQELISAAHRRLALLALARLEKRLSIALLLLLLAVLVFMTLERWSRGEAVMPPQNLKNRRIHPYAIKLDFPTTICTTSPEYRQQTQAEIYGQRAHSHTPPLTRTPHRRPETRAHARHATDDGVLHLAALACPAERAPLGAHGASARAARRCLWSGSAQRLGVVPTTTRESIAAAPRSAPGPAAGISAPDLGLGSDVFASPSPMPSGARNADLCRMGMGEGTGGGLWHIHCKILVAKWKSESSSSSCSAKQNKSTIRS
ncbi:hypothetical protein C8R45DRAFT_1152760 [Mycena sanguinolenta]|nr:hypothetical protein C8R45DRAFT_1152760 [Mycena sanguinolenta]